MSASVFSVVTEKTGERGASGGSTIKNMQTAQIAHCTHIVIPHNRGVAANCFMSRLAGVFSSDGLFRAEKNASNIANNNKR
jgi:hypothetical protein